MISVLSMGDDLIANHTKQVLPNFHFRPLTIPKPLLQSNFWIRSNFSKSTKHIFFKIWSNLGDDLIANHTKRVLLNFPYWPLTIPKLQWPTRFERLLSPPTTTQSTPVAPNTSHKENSKIFVLSLWNFQLTVSSKNLCVTFIMAYPANIGFLEKLLRWFQFYLRPK